MSEKRITAVLLVFCAVIVSAPALLPVQNEHALPLMKSVNPTLRIYPRAALTDAERVDELENDLHVIALQHQALRLRIKRLASKERSRHE